MTNLGERREIYFLGENGDGKSLILMALVLAFKGIYIREISDFEETGRIMDLLKRNKKHHFSGEDNQGNKYHLLDKINNLNKRYLNDIFAYGVHRSRNDSDKANYSGFMTLFDNNQYLISPEQFLLSLYTENLEKETGKNTTKTSISLESAKNILKDLVDQNVEIEVTSKGVKYIERGTHLEFWQLSEGYKSVITWLCDLIARLSEFASYNTELKDLKGVVLVDEINLHLHPRWEKKIVKKLRDWLPNVQFFFTTHSPVTILGASDDAVFYRVYKEDGKTKISEPYLKENWKDLMANSVLTSPLFGLEDARMESPSPAVRNLDTSDDYLHSRIYQKISDRLAQQKKEGKKAYFSKTEIDDMIEQALNEELS